MARGFLAVFSEPSPSLPLHEFHEWYEEEHIPIRMNHLKEFLSGARYEILGSSQSDLGWLAMYEIDDTKTFSDPRYTGLREKRSEREKSVMARLQKLVRILGEEIGVFYGNGRERSTGMKVGNPTRWTVTHAVYTQNLSVQDMKKVADGLYSAIGDNWISMRVVKVLQKAGVGLGSVPVPTESREDVEYLVIHGA